MKGFFAGQAKTAAETTGEKAETTESKIEFAGSSCVFSVHCCDAGLVVTGLKKNVSETKFREIGSKIGALGS